ncbi:MAG: ATP-dependent protease, Lon family [Firmicutes bacterium]|nr:ATP-dependent protease, Lon family [Bacillota bacterium]
MKGFIDKLLSQKSVLADKLTEEEQLKRQVGALYNLLANLYGSDKLILKASKVEALDLMRSGILEERVLGLQKLVFGDPTIDTLPKYAQLPGIINQIEEELADFIARRSVEDKIEKKINEKMQQRYEEYVKDIKMQIVKEHTGPENAQTLKRLARLEKLNQTRLTQSAIELLKPKSLDEIVGQERAVRALVSKLAAPFPQHILLYGPPGVGKTTTARLALEAVKQWGGSVFSPDAPFIEVDGTTLRWDPREVTNPLLGSVHDPIYQGARRDLAETGVPEPKLGLVTDAHGGILFIDEIGEMDPILQNKLLKVLEDKRVTFESSYYDPHDANIPQYIKKIFEEGAPADFVLIGATTRDAAEINPAIRSRCAEIYFEPLTPPHIQEIVRNAAQKLGIRLEPGVAEIISEYTIEGRKANNILADAYGLVLYEKKKSAKERPTGQGTEEPVIITKQHIYEVLQISRLSPFVTSKATTNAEVGKIFGLGVAGYVGSVLEIEAVAFPARERGKGYVRFNDTAGSMAKDSVFNATSVLRKLTGEDLGNYDIHVNVVGGGRIDGPSAGMAITLAIMSAVKNLPILQNVAVTGEISIQGRVKPVGGVFEKIYGAKQAGVSTVLVPRENLKDVPVGLKGVKVIGIGSIEEAMPHVFSCLQEQPLVG